MDAGGSWGLRLPGDACRTQAIWQPGCPRSFEARARSPAQRSSRQDAGGFVWIGCPATAQRTTADLDAAGVHAGSTAALMCRCSLRVTAGMRCCQMACIHAGCHLPCQAPRAAGVRAGSHRAVPWFLSILSGLRPWARYSARVVRASVARWPPTLSGRPCPLRFACRGARARAHLARRADPRRVSVGRAPPAAIAQRSRSRQRSSARIAFISPSS